MTKIDVNEYTIEKECVYEEERYSVRDNGAILRHTRPSRRIRANDNQWTFGKTNAANPYLHISGVRVHRIVATAFHGDPPDPLYVVDHIDTNARNNRPENLRWLTRLENALLNPYTRKKIEYWCGSIEDFLEDPSMLRNAKIESNYEWMRTVTVEEAKNCKERMDRMLLKEKKSSGGTYGEWLYKPVVASQPTNVNYVPKDDEIEERLHRFQKFNKRLEQDHDHDIIEPISDLTKALTDRCAQRNWRVPSNFPCCPKEVGSDPLESYYQNLKVGVTFSVNGVYPESKVLEFVKINNNSTILVMCEKQDLKPWSVAEITFENGIFVHTSIRSYFHKDGADKEFCIRQGLEWTGGDVFDDFC